eukprot:TRINITY_DN29219_c0_g4_i1.p1 TRINITY_DN29219_c0_g4~~TRINITY_DN29219_c0_g4_i1.p1  ORF type:complete len:332 (-),score=52.29 TRINITY_DN29219_c0_g4_i1:272-1267(-)
MQRLEVDINLLRCSVEAMDVLLSGLSGYFGMLVKLGIGALGLSAGVIGLIYHFQRKLLYVPVLPDVPKEYAYYPNQFNLDYEDVHLNTKDGIKLHAWMIKGIHSNPGNNSDDKLTKPTVLFFQENAGNMSWRLPFIRELVGQTGCCVFVLSYRGYGTSEGSPSQTGIQIDSQAAFDEILKRPDVDTSKIVLMGKSLGGAVALHLAAKNQNKVKALMVENTFTAVADMVPKMLPFLAFGLGPNKPLNFLVKDKWENKKQIQTLRSDLPVLMFACYLDELVPFHQMQELKKLCSSQQVQWVQFNQAHHMDAFETEKVKYWQEFKKFWDRYVIS